MSWDYHQPQQTSLTGSTNYLCRSTGKPCPNATEYGYCKQTVCNNCGEDELERKRISRDNQKRTGEQTMSEIVVRMEKVPKNCDDSCWGYLSGECPWSDHVDGYTMDGGRPRNCPIVGVLPEHGDLIDRDKLLCDIEQYHVSDGQFQHWVELQDAVIVATERSET